MEGQYCWEPAQDCIHGNPYYVSEIAADHDPEKEKEAHR
jgi:hypothetical protein